MILVGRMDPVEMLQRLEAHLLGRAVQPSRLSTCRETSLVRGIVVGSGWTVPLEGSLHAGEWGLSLRNGDYTAEEIEWIERGLAALCGWSWV